MAVTLGTPKNTRRLVDVGLSVTVALPSAASTTVNSNWINMAEPGAQPNYWGGQSPAGVGGSQPAGTNTSPAGPYAAVERAFFNIVTTASTNGNNSTGNNINCILQQAPTLTNGAVDTGNITNIPWRLSAKTTGIINLTNGAGTAVNYIDSIPPWIEQFVRIQLISEANIGNAADANATLQLLF